MATSTTPRTSATAKTTTRRAAAAKPKTATATTKAATTAPLPKVVNVTGPVVSEPDLKKKELIDLVVERSGIKKKDAKPTIEAVLAILGETLADGRELNLQPLGKLRINRAEEKSNGRVIICKLRQSLAVKKPENDPLAQAGE